MDIWESVSERAYKAFGRDREDFVKFCAELFGSRSVGRHLLEVLSGDEERTATARLRQRSVDLLERLGKGRTIQ